jgi:tetratricopeptide (TPR) repeat protein
LRHGLSAGARAKQNSFVMKPIYITPSIIFFFFINFSFNTIAQTTVLYNQEATDSHGNLILLGKTTRERLQQEPFAAWFNKNYSEYVIDSATAALMKPLINDKQFVIFMGTWCGDSRREVPRMYKMLDHLGVEPSRIQLINTSNHDTAYKQSPGHEERGLNIHRVPVLLVYENNKEIGRIVESPVTSLEKDLAAIINKRAYVPRYQGVPYLDSLFQASSLRKINRRINRVAEHLTPLVQSPSELHSYGNIQWALQQTGKAITVFRINTLLFPAKAPVWNALGAACIKQGDKSAAITYYRKAVELQPDNTEALARLQELKAK